MLRLGGTMKSLTKEERQVVARRIFAALCTHYPDCHIALFERPHVDSKAERVLTNSAAAPTAQVPTTEATVHHVSPARNP
jgi:hypothetical protein